MANIYDPIAFTQRVVFGMDTNTGLSTSNDYNDHIRPAGSNPTGFEFDMLDYLTNGGGRYAVPAIFPIIDEFFQSSSISPGTYFENSQNGGATLSIYDALNISDDLNTQENELSATTKASIWQYGTDTTSSDFAERAYLFGTTDFKLDISNAVFTVDSDDRRTVSGMRVIAENDNFDFKSDSPINQIANFFLLPAYDPYQLIRETVPIKYTTSTQGREYFYNDDLYVNDNIKEDLFISVKGTTAGYAKLGLGLGILLEDIKGSATRSSDYLRNIDSDPFFKYERGNSKVIYGTPGNDDIGVFKDIDIEFYNDNPIRVASGFDVPNSPNLTNLLMVGGDGNDTITSYAVGDELLGGNGNDVLNGGGGNDTLNGGADNDNLDGGEGNRDVAIFTEEYTVENYPYLQNADGTITFANDTDGIDTLKNIEWGFFKKTTELLPSTNSQTQVARRRVIPLPLADGVEDTEFVEPIDTTPSPNPNDPPTPPTISLTAPVSMLDGDVDYTLNISPYQPNTEYNISYIIDTSASMDAGELQQAKDAYTDLTNYFIDNEIAQNINFGVIQFSRYATPYFNLTASEAISTIEGLTASTNAMEGTKYNDALYQGMNFLSQSAKDALNTTNIAYFVSDGRSRTNFYDPYDQPYVYDAMNLRRFANVQAFGIDDGTNSAGGVTQSQLNFVDSNEGLIVGDASNLSSQLLKSGLANKVQSVNILLDGEVVETITPEQLTDSPLGLTYEGSVDGLDVSIDAENVITAEVVFTNEAYLATTTLDYTVTAGESEAVDGEGNDIPQSNNGNEDPFERIVDGGDSDDEITLGYADRGANGGAGGDEIIGNRRDNILDGGAGDDTISAYEGDDTIITGSGRDKVNGGSGIDTAIYDDVVYGDGSNVSLTKAGNSLSYNNTDTLTDVEFIQFSDFRFSSDTLEITPVVEVAELSITEGDSDLTTARLDFNLSTPAPVDVVFDYSSEDIAATAESDYIATSGSITIPAGETRSSINIDIIADKESEESEQFALNFSNLFGATFSNNLTNDAIGVTIFDDDIAIPDNAIAEYGTITNLSHSKQTIDLINTYTNPVVFVQPPSYNEEDPAIVRLDNITEDSFEAMIQEAEYLDDKHSSETASYFVFEAGTWQLEDGTKLEVGTNSTSTTLVPQGFDSVEFDLEFDTTPIVLSQVQTNNGTQFVRTRQQNPTEVGFALGLEEEEALKTTGHKERRCRLVSNRTRKRCLG